MAALPPKNKTDPRRPSLRGKLMQDVTQGVERSRAWPRSRGKPKSEKTREQNDWFRQMQWATKYMDSRFLIAAADAVKGTPLLPRDLLTMLHAGRLMAFSMEDGKRIYPVQAKQDVSQSLDVISQTEGYTLVRGPDGWEGQPQSSGSGWALHELRIGVSGVTAADFIDIPPCDEIMMIGRSLTWSSNQLPLTLYSTNNGASYYSASGDYIDFDANGAQRNVTAANFLPAAVASPRTIGSRLQAPSLAGTPKLTERLSGFAPSLFVADTANPINAIRFALLSGAAFSASSLMILVRGAQ